MPICSKNVSNTISTSLENANVDQWNLTIGYIQTDIMNKIDLPGAFYVNATTADNL